MTSDGYATYLGLHGWLISSRQQILVNPVFWGVAGHAKVGFRFQAGPVDPRQLTQRIDAVVLTGDSYLHLHLPSLDLLPRSVPIYAASHISHAATDAVELLGFAVHRPAVGRTWQVGQIPIAFNAPVGDSQAFRTTPIKVANVLTFDGAVPGLAAPSTTQSTSSGPCVLSRVLLPGAPAVTEDSLIATSPVDIFCEDAMLAGEALSNDSAGIRPGDRVWLPDGRVERLPRSTSGGAATVARNRAERTPKQLAAPFTTDREAITALQHCRAFLPAFGRELSRLLPEFASAANKCPADGIFLTNFLLGPRGYPFQFSFDATRMDFLPVRRRPLHATTSYRFGMTCHLNDFMAALGGHLAVGDLAAAGMSAWGPVPLVAHHLVEPLSAWSRPELTWRHLAATANELMEHRGLAALLEEEVVGQ